MFGMLDYRAHKLYLILFGIPLIVLYLISIFVLSFGAYLIGFHNAETWAIRIVFSIGSIIIIEILWSLFVFLAIGKLAEFIFGLFVDVIPADGRTKEEAMIVVYNGEKGITSLLTSKHPKEWTDENIQEISKLDWVGYLFFKDKIIDRCEKLRDYFIENSELSFNEWNVKEFFDNSNLAINWKEKAFASKIHRRLILEYMIFLFLILFNPLGI